jgi:hypothetical protein
MALLAILALSLLGNFFLLGVAMKERPPAGAAILSQGMLSDYPDDVRAAFRTALRQDGRAAVAALRDLRQARQTLARAAGASAFDEAEVRQAMDEVRTATTALQVLMQETLVKALREARTERAGD